MSAERLARAQAALAELQGGGLSRAEVSRLLGRNSSLVSQIARGSKPSRAGARTAYAPGEATTAALERLAEAKRAHQPVAPVELPRRTVQRHGHEVLAHTRRPATHRFGGGGTNTKVGRQALASGRGGKGAARVVDDAARAGRSVVLDLTFSSSAHVEGGSGKKGRNVPAAEKGRTVEFRVSDPEALVALAVDEHGGDVAAAAIAMALGEGLISSPLDADELHEHLTGMQLRTW